MARAVGDLLAEFDAELEDEVSIPPSWNVAPTDDVPIVLERLVDDGPAARQVRQLHVARWGLVPSWAKDPGIGSRMINARSESVLEKPAFRKAVQSRRCAVPAYPVLPGPRLLRLQQSDFALWKVLKSALPGTRL
ncbi:protein of unknown function DUF159 [Arthrobacter sp. DR-2P]|nr:protein of unknown function DUF159 [Arthrobacter sp. DR-2P]